MLPLRLLSVPAFTAGNVTAFLMSGAIFAAAFLTFQYFQLVAATRRSPPASTCSPGSRRR